MICSVIAAALVSAAAQVAAPAPAVPPDLAEVKRQLEELRLELEAQRAMVEANVAAQEQVHKEPSLRLYGFADTGLQKYFLSDRSAGNYVLPSDETTFVLGNLNVYMDAQATPDWSFLGEIRFTNYPNLSAVACTPGQECNLRTTSTLDITNPSGSWGEIYWGTTIIERAYVQWRKSDAFTLRMGTFLTPFGIWNLDHGTPTLISLMVPQFQNFGFFPTRQTGFEALGTLHGDIWTLDYVASISNGRGPALLDPTNDKMFGARLVLRRGLPFPFALGLSGLTGRHSDKRPVFISELPFLFERRETVSYRETTVGTDVSLDLGSLRLRSELAYKVYRGKPGQRELAFNRPYLRVPDHDEWAFYLLSAYQLPWWGLEPFVYFEVFRYPTPLSDGELMPSAGLNIHFTPAVQLKTQYLYIRLVNFDDLLGDGPAANNVHVLGSRLVIAF